MYEFAPEKEKEEHIWRRKRSKIFGEEKYNFWRRKKTEKRKERKRRKVFGEGKHILLVLQKNGEGKGRKCLEKENIFLRGEEKRGKGRKGK